MEVVHRVFNMFYVFLEFTDGFLTVEKSSELLRFLTKLTFLVHIPPNIGQPVAQH